MKTVDVSPAAKPEAVLFDMDGVLFDSMPVHAYAWMETARAFDLQATEREFYLAEGMTGEHTIRNLYTRQHHTDPDPALVERIYQHKSKLFRSHREEIPLIPGTLELMDYLHQVGVRMGVVTGSTTQNALPRIQKYYHDYIRDEYLVTADRVNHGKPHPEPYVRGLEALRAKSESTLVIENAPMGVQSAHAAGIFTIAVTTGPVPEHRLREAGANLVLPNMHAVLAWWRAKYE